MLQIKGKLIKILPVETGTSNAGKQYQRGGFVIEHGEEYVKTLAFDLLNDRIALIQPFQIGSMVTVNFVVESYEIKSKPGKYFTAAKAISIAPAAGVQPQPQAATAPAGGFYGQPAYPQGYMPPQQPQQPQYAQPTQQMPQQPNDLPFA